MNIQRRIAAKLDKTNAILVAGFNSLGQAIERLGDRTMDALQYLELGRSNDRADSVLKQLRQDADNRSEHEYAARRMLDNIQRRRKPIMSDPS